MTNWKSSIGRPPALDAVVGPCPLGVIEPPLGVYGEAGRERISAISLSNLVIRLSVSVCIRS